MQEQRDKANTNTVERGAPLNAPTTPVASAAVNVNIVPTLASHAKKTEC